MDYYNEIDPYAAQWLRNLIDAGHIAPGWVDTRSIEDVKPNELTEFRRCHFFAGIGGWALALEIAGWPSDRRVWTGSCPCQPFSAAGKGDGFADERHLWPAWQHLIAQCNPPVIFGEQVASKAVDAWIDLVHADLEGMGYAFGSIPFPAAGIGSPHIRDRNYWMAHAYSQRLDRKQIHLQPGPARFDHIEAARSGGSDGLADPDDEQSQGPARDHQGLGSVGRQSVAVGLAYRTSGGWREECEDGGRIDAGDGTKRFTPGPVNGRVDRGPCPTNGQWRDADWLGCRDGKWRPVEPGTFPLLDGLPASLERLGTLEMAGWEEIIRYGDANKTDPDQVLRMVRETFRTGSSRKEQQPGVLQQLHAEEVLFGYLFHVEAACDQPTVTRRRTKKSSEAQRRIVRSLRKKYGNGGSPCERRPSGQSNREPTNPLFELSFVLARYAQAYGEECRKAHAASGRVGMLRAYGNAIVPAQAAEFIGAYIDTY